MTSIFYWTGAAVSVAASLAVLAGALWLAGGLFINAGDRMLRAGLRVVYIANWRYWMARMNQEGITVMSKFYAEEVAKRKPKTPSEFEAAELASYKQEWEKQ